MFQLLIYTYISLHLKQTLNKKITIWKHKNLTDPEKTHFRRTKEKLDLEQSH